MPTSRGGYPLPVTSEDGYRCAGVPPIASRIMIASGQLSTDSFGANRLMNNRLGFGCPPLFAKGSALGRRPLTERRGAGASVGSRRDSAMAVSSHRAPNKRHCELRRESRWATWLMRRAIDATCLGRPLSHPQSSQHTQPSTAFHAGVIQHFRGLEGGTLAGD